MNKRHLSQTDTRGGAIFQGNVAMSENSLLVGRDNITIQQTVYVLDRFSHRILTHFGWFRHSRLEGLKAFSRARCLERWLALGIPDEKAISFFENPAFDRSQSIVGLHDPEPLIILIGDFGVGKSLIVEKIFQRLIDEAEDNKRSPIPILLSSSQLSGDLSRDIDNASFLIGSVTKYGAKVIIDGADEVSASKAQGLLQQAIVISKAHPQVSFIVASRPIALFEQENLKKIIVPELSQDEILAIVKELSDRDEAENLLRGLPQSIIDALKKPFFAILYGLYRRQLSQGIFKSKGELISHLVEMAVKNIEDPQILDLLQELAILTTEREGRFVPASDVGSDEQIKALLRSRLVIARQNLIGFALPILGQWFAAKSVENAKVPVNQVTSSRAQIEKWRYPLMVLASTTSFEKASRILRPIAEKHAGILPEIIDGAIRDHSQAQIDDIGLPTAREMGERIVESMQALSNGLGALAPYICPLTRAGKVSKIGVDESGGTFNILWYGDEQQEGIVELPEDFGHLFQTGKYRWSELVWLRPGIQSAWAWRFVLDALRKRLAKIVREKSILLTDGYLYRELMWKTALQTMRQGNLSHSLILLQELRNRLNSILGRRTPVQDKLMQYIANLEAAGETHIGPLWPGPDKDLDRGGWIWSPYSMERLLERQKRVVEAAIPEYESFVQTLFGTLGESLTTHRTLPAKFTGYVGNDGGFPVMTWYFEPLPRHEKSSVDIRLSDEQHGTWRSFVNNAEFFERLSRMRPDLSDHLRVSSAGMDSEFLGPAPVTDVVYDWLSRDLRDISWM